MKVCQVLLLSCLFAVPPLSAEHRPPATCESATGGCRPASSDDGHAHADAEEHEETKTNLKIPDGSLERFGLSLKEAGPATLVQGVRAAGRIVTADARLAHVSPRFAGVVKAVSANVGDRVEPGSILGVIQNNENLQTFTLTPSIAGVVLRRHATVGEVVTEGSVLFVVADLSELWAEIAVYKQDVAKVRLGQKVRLEAASDPNHHEGEVTFLSPLTDQRTQSRTVRVRLDGPAPPLSPGEFVDATIVTEETRVPLAVDATAVQLIDERPTVFVRDAEYFEPLAIAVGRSDGKVVEVLSDLAAGTTYAVGRTFVLKAEVGKSEAEHEH